ncbi:GntR family transcriptional regulator [Paracoccus litorisediminis]|jgi:GntR family transcriptional regulator of vanillate catabolism|uniref:FCD domain-containing protein n=1 Tax=Paracoccus litorisediminis TaxID=2006130 RepID=A0A844HSX6_9RHOB|nr:GntR family transcriptional regulator [Paracoccus litorisediminis]MTH62269.1 FCD domain-containing protein [Paracoccus litorisediminis]
MVSEDSARIGQSQTVRAAMTLRDMIIDGRLEPEMRYTETQLAELLSMSRTPIRAALQRLTDEGLLTAMPAGGYVIRLLLPSEISETIELRGVLEGLCARLLAERGCPGAALDELVALSAQIEALLADDGFSRADLPTYERLNGRFHQKLVAATESTLLIQELARANNRPFASASSLVGMYENDRAARQHLLIGQDHHRTVIEAIRSRQGARAEAIMREHARLSQRNLMRAVESSRSLELLRGASLIRQPDEETG